MPTWRPRALDRWVSTNWRPECIGIARSSGPEGRLHGLSGDAGLSLPLAAKSALRRHAYPLENQLADGELARAKDKVVLAEVVHLKDEPSFKPALYGRSS